MLETTYNMPGQNYDKPSKARKLIKDGVIPRKNDNYELWRITTVVDPGTGNIVSMPVPVRPGRPSIP
ncbi:MAG: hypothetical protein ACTSX1_09375 [Candidatus Heimdallarchaeaceae archaeon]